jgi:predicted RNA-binding Zn ribbon-like protein
VAQAAGGGKIKPGSLAELNRWLRTEAGGFDEIERMQGLIQRRRRLAMSAAEHALTPILSAISASLVNNDWTLVRKCESADCVLWFYDTSKNHARRWCSMELCGNRKKAAVHRTRKADKGV